jgi:thioredoxin 1
MDTLEAIKKKKLEELQKKYMNRGKTMEKKWPDTPIHLLDADIEEHIRKYPTIVIDCWAPWCGPCRMIGPIIEELAKEMQGKLTFGKLNVDLNEVRNHEHPNHACVQKWSACGPYCGGNAQRDAAAKVKTLSLRVHLHYETYKRTILFFFLYHSSYDPTTFFWVHRRKKSNRR